MLALIALGVAAAIRLGLEPWVGDAAPFSLFYLPVVIVSAWYGWRLGLLTTFGGGLLGLSLFLNAPHRFHFADPQDYAPFVLYFVTAILITFLTEWGRREYHATKYRAQELAAALKAKELLAAIIDSSLDAIVSKNLDGTIQTWNAGAERMLGYQEHEMIGKSVLLLIPPERHAEESHVLARLRAGEAVKRLETVRVAKDGHLVPVSITASPVRDRENRVIGVSNILRDISERKQAEEDLRAAKHAAEEANKAKDQFLAVLSHELRAPLTPVITALALLERRGNWDEGARENLEMIRRNMALEVRLIDDLLDVTRIARGKIELERKPVSLVEILHRAVEVVQPDIEARQLHFGVQVEAVSCCVLGDATRLQQVFWNLLRNAIKFTPHGGCVGVECRQDSDHAVVTVRDSGIGIPPENLHRIFDAFEQTDRAITRRFGGLSLGLAITKALVELHGGTIEARSEGRDRGATFVVRLPLASDVALGPAAVPAARPQVGPLRILLVEDHGDTARVLRRVLTLEGHCVARAGDVDTALELVRSQTFDLLISDLGLPDRTGLDLISEIRRAGFSLPAIALSGYGQEEDVRRSLEAGFAAHLTKPASPEKLLDTVASVIR